MMKKMKFDLLKTKIIIGYLETEFKLFEFGT